MELGVKRLPGRLAVVGELLRDGLAGLPCGDPAALGLRTHVRRSAAALLVQPEEEPHSDLLAIPPQDAHCAASNRTQR